MMVSYGVSSGTPEPVDIRTIGKASHFLTRPMLASYIAAVKDLRMRSSQVFQWLLQGEVKLTDTVILPLSEVKGAHDIIESRGTMGKILLRP
jgi:NADPH2:quinone reductase